MLDHDSEGCVKKKKIVQVDRESKKGGPLHKKAVAYIYTEAECPKQHSQFKEMHVSHHTD